VYVCMYDHSRSYYIRLVNLETRYLAEISTQAYCKPEGSGDGWLKERRCVVLYMIYRIKNKPNTRRTI